MSCPHETIIWTTLLVFFVGVLMCVNILCFFHPALPPNPSEGPHLVSDFYEMVGAGASEARGGEQVNVQLQGGAQAS